MTYVALLRGINVGGNNKISMAELKSFLENLGFERVKTYINSGNIVFSSTKPADMIAKEIESLLLAKFPDTTMPIKTLVISHDQLKNIIKNTPPGFGQNPETYHSDVAFLIRRSVDEAFPEFEVNPEVDMTWPGPGVVYYQRLSAKRTKSRLSKVISKSIYKDLTIRSWNTVTKLFSLIENLES